MEVKYATLGEVKKYLRIEDTENEGKLEIIVDSVNSKLQGLTSATKTDPNLKLACCIWAEVIFNSLGDRYISASGVAYNVSGDGVPAAVSNLISSYTSTVTTGEGTVDFL